MSNIDYNSFLHWCEDRFGSENIKVHGNEICTHSIFTEDYKYHLWMNPSGGKKEREAGVYRCWKSNKYGSLISLVSHVDKISYDEAEDIICNSLSLRTLEKKVDDFFSQYTPAPKEEITEQPERILKLPPNTYPINELSDFWKKRAVDYLNSRKLPTTGLFFCTEGDYANRIIIPYLDEIGQVIWYNARAINKNPLRYMKPAEKEFSQDDVLYFTSYPPLGSKVYVTEGEFDALTLAACGYYAIACGGKALSDSQIEILRNYIPVLAFDNDGDKVVDYGLKATIDIGKQLISKGFTELYFIRPSKGFKDWNEILVKMNPDAIKHYIEKYEKRLNQLIIDQLFS